MKDVDLYAYSHNPEQSREEYFSKWLFNDYEYAIDKEPNKYTSLKLHLKDTTGHPLDIISEVFMNSCTLEDNVSNYLKTGDVVYCNRFRGKNRIGADLCGLMTKYSELSFVYLFTEFGRNTTLNFTACQSDDLHEVQSKLINFLQP